MTLSGTEAVFYTLNRAGVAYLVVGGLAVNAHGYIRMTMDIDLVIALEPGNIIKALQVLAKLDFHPAVPITPEEFADPVNRKRWQDEKGMKVLKLWSDKYRLCPVDVFVYEPFNFLEELSRSQQFSLADDLSVPVVCLDTLLAMKKTAGRPQDLADIEALKELRDG